MFTPSQYIQILEKKIDDLTQLVLDDRQQFQAKAKDTDSHTVWINDLYRKVDDQEFEAPRRTYTTKLPAYNPQKETFRAYLRRFEVHCTNNRMSEDAKKSELVTSSVGSIDHILNRREIEDWTTRELIAECKQRMCPDLTITQVEGELYDINLQSTDDPEAVMRKIEAITEKADPLLCKRTELSVVQCEHFMRLIHTNIPMYAYIRRKIGMRKDPSEALMYAKEYLRERGDENRYNNELIRRQLESLKIPGVSAQALESLSGTWTPFQHKAAPGVPEVTSMAKTAVQEVGAACQLTSIEPGADEPIADFMARFLSQNEKVPMSEIIKRLNTSEQIRRDLNQCGVPDRFKGKTQNQQGQQQASNQGSNNSRQSWKTGNRQPASGNPSSFKKDQKSGNKSQNRDNKGGGDRKDAKFRNARRFRPVQLEVDGKLQQFYEPIDDEEEEAPEGGEESLDLQLDENRE